MKEIREKGCIKLSFFYRVVKEGFVEQRFGGSERTTHAIASGEEELWGRGNKWC